MSDDHVHTPDEIRRGIEIARESKPDIIHKELIRYCESLLAENESVSEKYAMAVDKYSATVDRYFASNEKHNKLKAENESIRKQVTDWLCDKHKIEALEWPECLWCELEDLKQRLTCDDCGSMLDEGPGEECTHPAWTNLLKIEREKNTELLALAKAVVNSKWTEIFHDNGKHEVFWADGRALSDLSEHLDTDDE